MENGKKSDGIFKNMSRFLVQTNVHQIQLDFPFYFLKLYMLPLA